ncbi:MAG: hypothetical protein IJW00_00900 [Clostridia bacterium]|nr:hypothetical protein [Clostridia bacterium]
MWMSVDRVEGSVVVLVADNEQVYHLDIPAYEALTGIPPKEAHMFWCEVCNNAVVSARFDSEETERRMTKAKAQLQRLINQKRS